MAVVVDDTSTVWNDHEENLLAVERYVWFPSSRRQFGLRGKSLLELNRWGRQQLFHVESVPQAPKSAGRGAVCLALLKPPPRWIEGEVPTGA